MSFARKTPYEKKYSRKGKEQEEWTAMKNALDSSAEQVSDINAILEQFEARSEEGRRVALNNLIRTCRNCPDKKKELEECQRLLIQYLIQNIRSTPSVALLAFSAIEVLAIVFGDDSDYFDALYKPVREIALTTAPQTLEEEQQQVVGAAMRTYGSLCFFCCANDDTTVDVIHDIDKTITAKPKDVSQPVLAGALSGWELIHSTTRFSAEYHTGLAAAIFSHLKSSKSSVDTRIGAIRSLALSYSLIAGPGDNILRHREWIPDAERLQDVINECSFGTTHPKRDRVKEQPLFKELAAWMLEGEDEPGCSLTLNSTKVFFSTWKIMARLNAVRRILDHGLLHHLLENAFLPDVLQYELPSKPKKKRMSEDEKKYARHVANLEEKAKSSRMRSRASAGLTFEDDD